MSRLMEGRQKLASSHSWREASLFLQLRKWGLDHDMSVSRMLASAFRPLEDAARAATLGPLRLLKDVDRKLHPEKHRQQVLGLEQMPPMQVEIADELGATPHLNVLLPRLATRSLTGGPNTALIIASGAAQMGVPVRLLALDEAAPIDTESLSNHVSSVAGDGDARPEITFGSTVDPASPFRLGSADLFLATYWTTASRLKSVLPRMRTKEFIYLIQDFEPGFYAWSSSYAQALQTYSMPFTALINEQLLADHFCETKTGLFRNPDFIGECTVFKPAVDRKLFYPERGQSGRKRLLFYARPNRPRNLFGMGFEALCVALKDDVFRDKDWSFVSIGDPKLERMEIGDGRALEPAPWLNFQDYARLMREADILLCPMLSPHTSYPVLEMAACRGIAVTNTFSVKTQESLSLISPRIIAGSPTIETLADCIIRAAADVAAESLPRVDVDLPLDWPTALMDAVLATHAVFQDLLPAT